MKRVLADTHALLWYLYDAARLSAAASGALTAATTKGGVLYLSAISLVEMTYLAEKGRIEEEVVHRVAAALNDPETSLAVIALDRVIAESVGLIPRALVPDMPDRIIAATALHLGLPLVTRDRAIQGAGIETIW